MMQLNRVRGKKGFTLIELMIVVAIIGILAAVAVPKFAEMIRKSKEGATKGSLGALRSALTIYTSDNEGFLPLQLTDDTNDELDDGAVGGEQEIALTLLTGSMTPKYIEEWPRAKLGQYHGDVNIVVVASTNSRGQSIASFNGTDFMPPASRDASGWVYTSLRGGHFFVNCSHTDTKEEFISSW